LIAGTRVMHMIRNERGYTLLKLIVTVAVMGLALVAILGLTNNVLIPDIHGKRAVAGAAARDYAKAIQIMVAGGGYVPCGNDSYASPDGFSAPPGYTASIAPIAPGRYVEYWNGLAWQLNCSPDTGMQRLTVQVFSNDGPDCDRASVCQRIPIVLRGACRPSSPQCG